ncbi:MAG: MoxR family ATPase [Pseudomonadota bacterium]
MAVNAMTVSAGEALDILRAGWTAQKTGALTTSWMLHGRPGVGKTQIVTALAQEIGARLFDLRLTTIEPQDLRGLPYYDHERRRTIWYRPEDLPDAPDRPSVLFLDELTAAPPHLQPTVYGLLQERRVGQHRLPDAVFVVAAGNTVEDGAIAYEMGMGLSDRLVHVTVAASATDWLERYAVPHRLDPAVIAFVKSRPDLLETTASALDRGQMIAATPRSWEKASAIMAALADRPSDRRLRNAMLAGTLGEEVAAEFILIADEIAATVQVAQMLQTPRRARRALYPDSMHGLNALLYGLVAALSAETLGPVVETLADIRDLAKTRPEPVFARLPLAELTTYGFEILIRRGLEMGLGEAFLADPSYRAYAKEREALGLA